MSILFSFLKNSLTKNCGLTDFFPSNIIKMLFHSLLGVIVPNEKSAITHIIIFLYVTCCFSLAAFKIFSLCLNLRNMIVMYLCVVFIVFILSGGMLSFLDL